MKHPNGQTDQLGCMELLSLFGQGLLLLLCRLDLRPTSALCRSNSLTSRRGELWLAPDSKLGAGLSSIKGSKGFKREVELFEFLLRALTLNLQLLNDLVHIRHDPSNYWLLLT